MIGWIADWFRTAWALIIWNLRKSVFRLRRNERPCPCQNPSDSGRAWETRCDACFNWHRPARFHRVCPLLRRAPDGTLKCSADTSDVRPFWGRFLGFYGAGAVSLWLLAALLVFGGMRLVGYPVRLQAVLWPPAWPQINHARSAYFLNRAQEAYAQQRISESLMSLTLAYDYDPANYQAGLLLARIWQTGRTDASDRLYQQLLAEHPATRPTTAQHWLRALLPRGEFAMIEPLAAAALRFDPAHGAGWTHAFLFANERTGNAEQLNELLASEAALPAGPRRILELESACRSSAAASMRPRLMESPGAGMPDFVAHYQARRLVSLGFPADAVDVVARESARLSARDQAELTLLAYQAAGYRRLLVAAFDRVIAGAPSPNVIELVCAHLIQHPNQELFERFVRQVDPTRLPPGADRHSALLALFCVAGIHGDTARAEGYSRLIQAATDARGAALSRAGDFLRRPAGGRIENVLPDLQPLALEVNYALLARFAPSSHPSPRP